MAATRKLAWTAASQGSEEVAEGCESDSTSSSDSDNVQLSGACKSSRSDRMDHDHSSSRHIVQDGSCCYVARPARGCIAHAMIL